MVELVASKVWTKAVLMVGTMVEKKVASMVHLMAGMRVVLLIVPWD